MYMYIYILYIQGFPFLMTQANVLKSIEDTEKCFNKLYYLKEDNDQIMLKLIFEKNQFFEVT